MADIYACTWCAPNQVWGSDFGTKQAVQACDQAYRIRQVPLMQGQQTLGMEHQGCVGLPLAMLHRSPHQCTPCMLSVHALASCERQTTRH